MLDHIKLDILTEDQISTQEHALDGLWMLQYKDETKGPFSTAQLKSYSEDNHELFDEIEATNLLKNKFINFYQNIEFQRRKPKLVQASSLVSDDDFFVLVNGQKDGPYSLSQIQEKSQSKQIRLSSLISTDKGQTWIKLYEHHEFDRRSRNVAAPLPYSPEDNFVHEAMILGRESIKNAQEKKAEEDAIVGLAFLSHGQEHAKNAQDIKSNNWVQKTSTKKVGFKFATAFVVAALVITTSLLNSNSTPSASNKVTKTTKRAINNTQRQAKRFPASAPIKKTPQKYQPMAKKKVVTKQVVKPKRYIQNTIKKAPRRITHFADEFDDSEEFVENEREVASTDEPQFYPEDELTQEQIEAIELGDPSMLEETDFIKTLRNKKAQEANY